MPSLQQILWAIIIGVAIGAVMTFYTKRVLGGFIKKLLERDAFDPESAVGFDELGIKKSGLLKYSLREGTSFSETVLNEGGKYYIPESSIDKAEKKYGGETMSVFVVLVILAVLFVTALICSYAFPELLSMLGISTS